MPLNRLRGPAFLGFVAAVSFGSAAWAQPPATHEIPQSQFVEHQENLEHLTKLSGRPGSIGLIARRAITLTRAVDAREAEYIMPPLTLLPYLIEGTVTPDMKWALIMADRVRADREVIFKEHTQMIDSLNALRRAGEEAHDAEAVEFAKNATADALTDVEILEPAAILVGDVLRAKLSISR